MKAIDAQVLVAKHKQIKETLQQELQSIYNQIESSAMQGLSVYYYSRGWLNSKAVDSILISAALIKHLNQDGYVVEQKYENHNKPFLLISWAM